ncbi:MAG: carbohydrate ABC transporter permease [Treponema sp.]|jgi:ABC-type glycerol-3-phosphate transport system permease component|nr:carbohydrate ABC transporter permease [Treponema sp.]
MKNTHHLGKRSLIQIILSTVLIIATALIVLFPLYWMLVTSLKMESEIFKIPPSLIPNEMTMENFLYTFNETKIPVYFLNSVIYAVCTLLLALLCASFAAYSLSRFKFRGKVAYLLIILFTQLMPLTTLIVPLYVSLGNMGMLNNRMSLVLVYAAVQIPIATWLLLGYFNSIPRAIDEAATIDGCNSFMVLHKMILPLSKPGLMAVGLSVIISVWQELMLATTFINMDNTRPLMAGVSAAITKSGIRWGQMTATGVIACIPIILIYIFMQRYLVQGLTGGAVKG